MAELVELDKARRDDASIRTVEKCGAQLATFADLGAARVHRCPFELG